MPTPRGGRSWNALRRIVGQVTTPLLPDDYLKLANPLWSARELRGRVVEVRRETADSATLVIKPGWGFSFDYEPGQYVGIGVLIDGRWRWRSYSLTSTPEKTPSGLVRTDHRDHGQGDARRVPVDAPGRRSAAGDRGPVGGPQGNFVMPAPAPATVLFVTAGSGITPVMSMLRTLVRRDQITDIVHVHSAPTESDVLFGQELAALHDDASRLPAAVAQHPQRRQARSDADRRRGPGLA